MEITEDRILKGIIIKLTAEEIQHIQKYCHLNTFDNTGSKIHLMHGSSTAKKLIAEILKVEL